MISLCPFLSSPVERLGTMKIMAAPCNPQCKLYNKEKQDCNINLINKNEVNNQNEK